MATKRVSAPLLPKHARFVLEYMKDLNGTKAAVRAGYEQSSAACVSSELLQREDVQGELQRQLEAREARTLATADRVIQELALIAFSDITDFVVREDGSVTLREGAGKRATRAVQSVKRKVRIVRDRNRLDGDGRPVEVEVEDVEIKLWDKARALEVLARHLGLLKDRVEVSGPNGEAVQHVQKIVHQLDAGALREFAADVARAGLDGVPEDSGGESLDPGDAAPEAAALPFARRDP